MVCQHQRTARGQKAQLAALIGQQDADAVFGKVQSGSQIGQSMLKPGTAQSPQQRDLVIALLQKPARGILGVGVVLHMGQNDGLLCSFGPRGGIEVTHDQIRL